MLPVQGLSGIEHKLSSDMTLHNVAELSLEGATVRARQRSRDTLLAETQVEGKRPFTLLAIIHRTQRSSAADYLCAHLPAVIARTLLTAQPTSFRTISPLYAALVKLHQSYLKVSPEADSIFSHASISAALLDLRSGVLYTASFGPGSFAPHVSSALGHAATPTRTRVHTLVDTLVEEAAYDNVSGTHRVLLGSPGLWQHTHPSKAALSVAAFANASHLSTHSTSHDPATAAVRTALRSIAERCAASPSARMSCLNTLAQLDRLRPGCREEACRSAPVVPRMRGDVHADLTAAVLSFALLSPSHSRTAACEEQRRHTAVCPMCRFAANNFQKCPTGRSLTKECAAAHALSLRSDCKGEALAQPSEPCSSPSEGRASSRSFMSLSRTLSRISSRLLSRSSAASMSSSRTPRSSVDSPAAACRDSATPSVLQMHSWRTEGSSLPGAPSMAEAEVVSEARFEAQRRWKVLQRHVQLRMLETGLRQSMWQAAVSAALESSRSAKVESAQSCECISMCSSDGCSECDSPKQVERPMWQTEQWGKPAGIRLIQA